MLLPIEKGGTTKYVGKDIFFYEYTHQPLIIERMDILHMGYL